MNENSPYPLLNETDLLEFALRLATYPNDPVRKTHKSYQAKFLTNSQKIFHFLKALK